MQNAFPSFLAGMARLERTNDGVKVRCLTTWLHPHISGSKKAAAKATF